MLKAKEKLNNPSDQYWAQHKWFNYENLQQTLCVPISSMRAFCWKRVWFFKKKKTCLQNNMDYGLHHKTLAVEWGKCAHTLVFDHWAVNLQHTLPRMEVRHEGERKTWPRSLRSNRFWLIRGAYRCTSEALFNCSSPHWLTTHHHHRFFIISLTNSLCSLTWGCLPVGQNSDWVPRECSQGFTAVALIMGKNAEDQTK